MLTLRALAAGLTLMMACASYETAVAKQPEGRNVAANGTIFPTLIWGPTIGRPVLLLHGFPQEARTWSAIAEALAAAGYRVVAFDQRGYVESIRGPNPTSYNFNQFVEDALAVADACALKRFDVAGMGMGGAQAWILAARHPDRIRSLVSLRFPHPAAFAYGIRNDPAQAASWAKLQEDIGGSLQGRVASMLVDNATILRGFLVRMGLPQPWVDSYIIRLQHPAVLEGALSWERAVSLDEFGAVPAVTVPTYYFWSSGPALAESTAQATSQYVTARYDFTELQKAGNFKVETSSDRIAPAMLKFYKENAK